jgi:hypothetical protein
MKIIKYQTFTFILFCAIPISIGIIYLLAFYPGVLSFDSVNQWDQLSQFSFSNWHPAYHTILMWLVTRMWYSPAAVALFQIIIYGLVLGYGLCVFKNDFGVSYFWLILLDVAISIVPINGIMLVTLWKDVLYSIFVLLLTIYVLNIINSNGDWIAYKNNWIYLGLVIANISLLRHTGFPVGFGTLLICMFFFHHFKYFTKTLVVSILFVAFVIGPVYKVFNVDKSSSQSFGVIFIHPITAQINAGASLTKNEQEFLNEIFPLKETWTYSCYDATVFFYKGVDFQPVQESPLQAGELLYKLTLMNPVATINHFMCLSSFVWQVKQPSGVYLETILFSNIDASNYDDWKPYQDMIVQRSKMQSLRDLIIRAVNHSYSFDPNKVMWRPAIYFYTFLTAVFLFFLRSKNRLVFILLSPVLLQSLIISFTAQLQALRYQYPIYIVSMLFSFPIIYASLKNKRSESRVD